ncbi:hypothetical protein PSPO01_05392 [Paraphaeosphaeria sporulosa]
MFHKAPHRRIREVRLTVGSPVASGETGLVESEGGGASDWVKLPEKDAKGRVLHKIGYSEYIGLREDPCVDPYGPAWQVQQVMRLLYWVWNMRRSCGPDKHPCMLDARSRAGCSVEQTLWGTVKATMEARHMPVYSYANDPMAALSCVPRSDRRRANELDAVQLGLEIRPVWIEYGASALQKATEHSQKHVMLATGDWT